MANVGQGNADNDHNGDACDADADNDLLLNAADNCPLAWNPSQSDVNTNGLGDVCDEDADSDGMHACAGAVVWLRVFSVMYSQSTC